MVVYNQRLALSSVPATERDTISQERVLHPTQCAGEPTQARYGSRNTEDP